MVASIVAGFHRFDDFYDIQKEVIHFSQLEPCCFNIDHCLTIHIRSDPAGEQGHKVHHDFEWVVARPGVLEHEDFPAGLQYAHQLLQPFDWPWYGAECTGGEDLVETIILEGHIVYVHHLGQ